MITTFVNGYRITADLDGWRIVNGSDLTCPMCCARYGTKDAELDRLVDADDMVGNTRRDALTPETPWFCQSCERPVPVTATHV